jgi:acyl-CoA oxidase
LKLVCDLYALNQIWNDIGTYRNVDYVAPNKAKVFKCPSELKKQKKKKSKEREKKSGCFEPEAILVLQQLAP